MESPSVFPFGDVRRVRTKLLVVDHKRNRSHQTTHTNLESLAESVSFRCDFTEFGVRLLSLLSYSLLQFRRKRQLATNTPKLLLGLSVNMHTTDSKDWFHQQYPEFILNTIRAILKRIYTKLYYTLHRILYICDVLQVVSSPADTDC